MLTADQIRTALTEKLPEIERRVAWLRERELAGTGRGQDTQRRIVHDVTDRLADLRTSLELPAAPEPTFDETIYS